jgi:hypothetical protein
VSRIVSEAEEIITGRLGGMVMLRTGV